MENATQKIIDSSNMGWRGCLDQFGLYAKIKTEDGTILYFREGNTSRLFTQSEQDGSVCLAFEDECGDFWLVPVYESEAYLESDDRGHIAYADVYDWFGEENELVATKIGGWDEVLECFGVKARVDLPDDE